MLLLLKLHLHNLCLSQRWIKYDYFIYILFIFLLVLLKGKLLLAADSAFERDKWIDMLQKSKRMLVSYAYYIYIHLIHIHGFCLVVFNSMHTYNCISMIVCNLIILILFVGFLVCTAHWYMSSILNTTIVNWCTSLI